MKKFAAAALAATVSLSLAAAPAIAASNKMSGLAINPQCEIRLDSPTNITLKSGTHAQKDIAKKLNNPEFSKITGGMETSSKLGQAFGSSNQTDINDANNAAAIQACVNSQNYQSQPMSEGEKTGIIIAVVLGVIGAIVSAAWPVVAPMLGM